MKVILIGGASGSGKSTLARRLKKVLVDRGLSAEIVGLDRFYRELDHPNDRLGWDVYVDSESEELSSDSLLNFEDYNFDHPAALDVELILKCLRDLQGRKRRTQLPMYDFKTCKRIGIETMKAPEVLIIEGILALHLERLRRKADIKLFVKADPDTCLIRRIRRDMQDRGRTLESTLGQYQRFVKPSFLNHVQPSSLYADLIIPTDDRCDNGIVGDMQDKITQILAILYSEIG